MKVEQIDRITIEKYLADFANDGHAILPINMVLEYGFPESLVKRLEKTHKSFPGPGGTISVDGVPVSEYCGVYSLDLLREIVAALHTKAERMVIGRGAEAQLLTKAICTALEGGER